GLHRKESGAASFTIVTRHRTPLTVMLGKTLVLGHRAHHMSMPLMQAGTPTAATFTTDRFHSHRHSFVEGTAPTMGGKTHLRTGVRWLPTDRQRTRSNPAGRKPDRFPRADKGAIRGQPHKPKNLGAGQLPEMLPAGDRPPGTGRTGQPV